MPNKTANINCKKRYRFRKRTLYEREVIKKAKILYSLAEASILIQQVVRQSLCESLLLTDFLGTPAVHRA